MKFQNIFEKLKNMSFKKGNNLLIGLIAFLIGGAISYIACQYKFFSINTDINVIELLISVGTIGIGLYIAIILENNRNKSQNFYSYVEGKYDALWEVFIQFSEVLELSQNIEITKTSKYFKTINQKLTPLIKVFESFDYDSNCLTSIEKKIDDLEDYISNNKNIQNQILDLSKDKTEIVNKLNEINELFAKSFKDLANI